MWSLEPIEIGAKPMSQVNGRETRERRNTLGRGTRPQKKNETEKLSLEDIIMKTWTKPAVREQEVGLEVTSYLPAEIDVI
jgi:coenzyme PQQ precursor peptide PqqA